MKDIKDYLPLYIGQDNAWSIESTLQRLSLAAEKLLHYHSYDGMGYEEIEAAIKSAKELPTEQEILEHLGLATD